jgi:protein TonB
MHFIKKFDASLPNKLGLSKGRKRIFISFKIDKNGDIIDVKVKAPHPTIIDEVKKVMYLLPKIIPGKQTGKNVNVKYSIPFTLFIE